MHAWASKAHEKIKILIVDDCPEDREVIREYLSKAALGERVTFDYLEASKGEDGLALQRAGLPDCILLDHHLPDMSGLDFLARLKDGVSETPVPVVMLTGSSDRSLSGAALRAGAQEYLPKQFLVSELLLRAVQSSRHHFNLIAERRRAEEALRHSEQQIGLMFDSVRGHAIFMLDTEGRIMSWNPGAEKLKGYAKEDVIGRHFSLLYPPEDVASGKPKAELIIAVSNGRVEDEGWRVRKDGSRFMASVIINAIKNPHGDLRGFVKVTRDITARKKIENELIETSTRLRNVLASASEFSMIATDPKLVITVFNAGAEKLLGYAAAEMIGRATPALFHDDDEMRARGEELSRQLGHPVEGVDVFIEPSTLHRPREWTYMRKDGRRVRVSLVVTAMRSDFGDLIGYLGVAHDVTHVNEVEEKLREAKLLAERASRAKSAFLASMSHEIRTPMNGVLGFVDLLLDSDLTQQQRNHTTRLQDAAKSLLALINDILDLSKIEAGKLAVEWIPMSPETVVHSATSIVRAQLAAKGLGLIVEMSPDLPLWIESDPTRLRQIILNLLSNALKFTDRGRITVRCWRETSEDGDLLRFEVEDTGIGIPADRRHLLFQDFSQIDNSTTRRYGGTGLGLSICKRLTEAMGGDIGVRSIPGRGSTLWFTIALRLCPAPDLSLAQAPTPFLASPARVLVADDLEMNRDIVETMLRRAGHSVRGVEIGRQAVIAVEESDFDLVLMDMEMPEMDGVEATRAIRRLDERIRHIPIVALTANAFSEDQQRCRQAGMNDFLPKPISRDGLLAMVAKWAHGIPVKGTETAPSPARVLDLEALDAFDSALGLEAAARLSGKFRLQVRNAVAVLTSAKDPAFIAREAHKLTGLSATLGCAELASFARLLCSEARRENGDFQGRLIDMPGAADRALAALAARYP